MAHDLLLAHSSEKWPSKTVLFFYLDCKRKRVELVNEFKELVLLHMIYIFFSYIYIYIWYIYIYIYIST